MAVRQTILPYATATSGDKALMETQRILSKFGCQSFGTMIDAERGVTMVYFKHRGRQVQMEASWKGYAAAMYNLKPYKFNMRGTKEDYWERLLKQAQISVCSVLRDWVKAQITAVECGIVAFDSVFMPYMLLPNGERLVDMATRQLESQGIKLLEEESAG